MIGMVKHTMFYETAGYVKCDFDFLFKIELINVLADNTGFPGFRNCGKVLEIDNVLE